MTNAKLEISKHFKQQIVELFVGNSVYLSGSQQIDY